MYKVTFQDNSTEEAYQMCYDKDGNMFGYVAYNNVFKSLEKVKSIDKEVTVTEQIWPPVAAPAPEKRPFKVGDRVKVVSLERGKKEWPDSDETEYDYKIGDISTIDFISENGKAISLKGFRDYAHIDDLEHIDQPQQDEFNVDDWVEVVSLENTKKHLCMVDDTKIGKTFQIRMFLKNGLINLSDQLSYHPLDLIPAPQSS